ncbi:MAG TPA: ATP-dependent metallopeptidase FtsH/Yme1/Tma family protein, partial [Verrucomicrobiae bacterium]|nr:ATP-dependent metallopeptidase FtsH/Yme1/Tma family protein [Verrucomicrobiae bacterium]
MFDEDDNNKRDDRNPKKPNGGGGFSMPPFTWVAWIVILGALVALMLMKGHFPSSNSGTPLTEAEFLQKFSSNQIDHATITYPTVSGGAATITGKYFETDSDGKIKTDSSGKPITEVFVAPTVILTPNMEDKLLTSNKVEPNVPNPMLSDIGYQLLFFVGIGVLFWFFFIRQIKIAGKGALSFGRSK